MVSKASRPLPVPSNDALGPRRESLGRLHPPCMKIKMSDNAYKAQKSILTLFYQSEEKHPPRGYSRFNNVLCVVIS